MEVEEIEVGTRGQGRRLKSEGGGSTGLRPSPTGNSKSFLSLVMCGYELEVFRPSTSS